jgi:Flp pilus assembly protein CpaB
MSRVRIVVVATALAAAFGAGALVQASGGDAPVREALAAKVDLPGAKGRTLALSRVTVPVGAELPTHRHTGTQIARVAQGTLTYSVKTGSVVVRRGEAGAGSVVRRIAAGQTGPIKAGQWIAESPAVVHGSSNQGSNEVVIYLATLLPNGDPPSVPDR